MVIGYAPYTVISTNDKILALEYFSHATIAAATTGLKFPLTCVGTNIAYRKEVFFELDGFGQYKHIHTGDDDLFLQRVRDESNWEIRYSTSQKTHVFNAPPDSWKKFYNQRLRYASKGFEYPAKVTFSVISYYLFNLFLLLTGIISLLAGSLPAAFISIIILKGITELLFMKKAAKIISENRLLYFFPIVFFLHIPYVVYFGLMGNLQKFDWSGVKQ